MLYKFIVRDNNVVAVGDIDMETLQAKLDANYSDFGASTLERYMEQVLNPNVEQPAVDATPESLIAPVEALAGEVASEPVEKQESAPTPE
jgi:hypothetical protein